MRKNVLELSSEIFPTFSDSPITRLTRGSRSLACVRSAGRRAESGIASAGLAAREDDAGGDVT